MKHRIKLLKAWKDATGAEHAAGTILEVDENTAKSLCFDGTAAKDASPEVTKSAGDIDAVVKTAVADALKDLPKTVQTQVDKSFQVRDRSDEDPFHGYLPGFNGDVKSVTKSQRQFALGQFAGDVFLAGADLAHPTERMRKSIERQNTVTQKRIELGMVSKAAGTGMTASEGDSMGALIPPEIQMALLDTASETATIRPRATIFPLSSNAISLPQVKDYDRSSGLLYGGVICYWKGEDALLSESRPKTETVELRLHALTALAYASHETMRFAPFDMGGFLLPLMGKALTWKEEDALINGTGAGMPQGLLNSPALLAVAIESGQKLANPVVTENIDNMIQVARIEDSSRTIFLYNRTELYAKLRRLKVPIGTAGVLASLFEPSRSGQPSFGIGNGMLDGIPIFDNERMPAAGTKGDLLLVDCSQIIMADDRQGPEVAQSMHLKFDYGQMAFRIIAYRDAQFRYKSTFRRYKGSNSYVSGLVAIDTRSA